jgi:hypothetical protein
MTEQSEWLTLQHEETQGLQRVAATLTDGDLEFYKARGWHLVDAPDDSAPFVPQRVDVEPGEEFVELVHPETQHRHQFPNNRDALAGAYETGWVQPNKDGSIPTPATARRRAAAADRAEARPATDESPDADTAAENDQERPTDSAATDQEE